MLKFNKSEKVVLIAGVLVILLIIVLGFAKQTFIDKKKKPFEAPAVQQNPTADNNNTKSTDMEGITLKKASFTVEVNETLNVKTSTYVKADKNILQNIEINFDEVDVTNPGSYTAVLSYQDQTLEIPIVVKDSKAPVITVANAQVEFTLEANSNVQELIDFVSASAEDNYDGVIMVDKIQGWPSELPKSNQTKTYTLSAKDSSGNVGKKDIVVQYFVEAANPANPENTENQTRTENE